MEIIVKCALSHVGKIALKFAYRRKGWFNIKTFLIKKVKRESNNVQRPWGVVHLDDIYEDDQSVEWVFTLRPASLLCKFISARQTCWFASWPLLAAVPFRSAPFLGLRLENRCSRASTNVREKLVPKWTLSEQPAHWKPSGEAPRTVRSHPQSSNSPAEQALVSAWATPAAEIACTNAASRVPFNFLFTKGGRKKKS